MVILSAALTFALLAAEYLKPYPYYGPRQLLAVAVGVSIMLAGAGWEVVSGRRSADEALRFWAVAGYVSLLVLALRAYSVETRSFYEFIALLALFGFIINHHLPAAFRRPFFLLVCFVAIAGVFGFASVPAALGLVCVALALIGICHLPIPMWARIALLLACAAGLATVRVGWIYVGWAAVVLPILASMFMFRLAIYLYDTSNNKGPKDIWGRLSYFFMFPNLIFPFFPVVDFATFGRAYYNDDAIRIYHRAATFMLRGLAHLLVYRIVHVYFVLAPEAVEGPLTFLQYIVSNFALYFRISGTFHLITGLLGLFGFNLPETHSRFYFSNSFVDIWRRMNIYWKDFMQKMFFNPSYIRFKRLGASHTTSVALAMGVVFAASWALHTYQWFWLSGTMFFSLPDLLFWCVLGLFLVAQTFYEARPKKQPTAAGRPILGARALLAVRTACTFFTLCLLWSFWTSPSISAWWVIVRQSQLMPALGDPLAAGVLQWLVTIAVTMGVLACIAVTAGVAFGLDRAVVAQSRLRRAGDPAAPVSFTSVGLGAAAACTLLALQSPAFSAAGQRAQEFASSISRATLNPADEAMLERGYYEGLMTAARFNPELWELQMRPPEAGGDDPLEGRRSRSDYLSFEYVPNATVTLQGKSFRTNRWGMPDRDYDIEKPAGTYRIVLIEASRAVGAGVKYEDRFETLLERRLNDEHAGGRYKRYEVLNFSVHGYVPVQRLMAFEQEALKFRPDAVLYLAGIRDTDLLHHVQMVRRGVAMPYGFLDDVNKKAGIERSMSEQEMMRRLQPYRFEFIAGVYHRFAERIREQGARAIWIYVPLVSTRRDVWSDVAELTRLAQAEGFVTADMNRTFLDLEDWADHRLSRWDSHPNERGHRLLMNVIYDRLKKLHKEGRIDLGLRPSALRN